MEERGLYQGDDVVSHNTKQALPLKPSSTLFGYIYRDAYNPGHRKSTQTETLKSLAPTT